MVRILLKVIPPIFLSGLTSKAQHYPLYICWAKRGKLFWIRVWLFGFKRQVHSGRYPPISLHSFSLSIQMLHSHLHLNVQLLSPHSSSSSFLFPSSKFRIIPSPTPIKRTSSSTLRLRSSNLRIKNSSTNNELNETENKKPLQHTVNRPYPFHEIEPKWQRFWDKYRTFRTPDDDIDTSKPKYYVLDMFPYPRFSLIVI